MKYLLTKVTSENSFNNCLSLFYVSALKIQQCIRQIVTAFIPKSTCRVRKTNKQAQKDDHTGRGVVSMNEKIHTRTEKGEESQFGQSDQ